MRRLLSIKEAVRRSPLVAVEFIISIFTLAGGLYLLSPLLQVSTALTGGSPVVQVIASDLGILILGLVTSIAAALVLAGIVRGTKTLRATGLFTMGLIRLYVLLATWLINGLLPVSWLSNATLMAITFYLWWKTKGRDA